MHHQHAFLALWTGCVDENLVTVNLREPALAHPVLDVLGKRLDGIGPPVSSTPVSVAAHEVRTRTRAPLSVGFLLSTDQKAPVFELEPTSGPDL
jgi:hypothetical protein